MIDDFHRTLRAAQAGDERAVATLWCELNHRVVRFLKVRAGDAAEDIASETWLTISTKLGDFQGDEVEFRAWLFTVARCRLIDWQRRQQRRPEHVTDDHGMSRRAAADDPATEALAMLDRDAVLALISRLSTDQGDVILLRVLAGLDVARVAMILGKRPGTVRMLQLRGLRRLEQLLSSGDRETQDVTR